MSEIKKRYDSVFAYSLPCCKEFIVCKGILRKGIFEGFIIGDYNIIENGIKTIAEVQEIDWQEAGEFVESELAQNFNICGTSTSKEEYMLQVNSIINELSNNSQNKTITCRKIVGEGFLDIKNSLESLTIALPNTFRFFFYTPDSGCWLGASPELLLEAKDNVISSYALAGTRVAGINEDWDLKNTLEHQIVVDYIQSCFEKFNLNPIISPIRTLNAGSVEHLFAQIDGIQNRDFNIYDFLLSFSPTPALCGMPVKESMERVKRLENFQREFYGGFCGLYDNSHSFKLYVILRSLKFTLSNWCFFAGGGITSKSDANLEWIETERKAESVIKYLKFKKKNTNLK